jgi:hypothetical protein
MQNTVSSLLSNISELKISTFWQNITLYNIRQFSPLSCINSVKIMQVFYVICYVRYFSWSEVFDSQDFSKIRLQSCLRADSEDLPSVFSSHRQWIIGSTTVLAHRVKMWLYCSFQADSEDMAAILSSSRQWRFISNTEFTQTVTILFQYSLYADGEDLAPILSSRK